MSLDDGCVERISGTNVVLRDPDGGSSEFRLQIASEHRSCAKIYIVDNCLVKVGIRCDYLVLPNDAAAVFVELKGGDVEKGFAQLEASVSELGPSLPARSLYAVLVPTRCPIPQYETAKAQDRFRRRLNCRLRIKNRVSSWESGDF